MCMACVCANFITFEIEGLRELCCPQYARLDEVNCVHLSDLHYQFVVLDIFSRDPKSNDARCMKCNDLRHNLSGYICT